MRAAPRRNQPNVHESKLLDNSDGWHGAELSVVIAGNWQYYRAKVRRSCRCRVSAHFAPYPVRQKKLKLVLLAAPEAFTQWFC